MVKQSFFSEHDPNVFNGSFSKNKTGSKILDILVLISVFTVTIFLILYILSNLNKINIDWLTIVNYYFYFNIVIYIVFVLDLIRLWNHSDGFKDFVSNNWLDIIATIPFGFFVLSPSFEILKVTRAVNLLRLQKATKISLITKEFKVAAHMKNKSKNYKKKHRL